MKNSKCFSAALFLFLLISNIFYAQTKEEKISQLISRYNEYRLFNGSVLVANQEEVILKKGFGFANMEWNLPNEPDTKFRLGSITKQFTSMIIMQLVEKGKVKLDGKITDYLPYYRKDTGSRITIEMLLTHTSGIPSYTSRGDFGGNLERKFYRPDDFVREFCSGDLEFEPTSRFLYDNSGYFILGTIIEHVTGLTYEEALKRYIFEPLGMKNSGYDLSETILKNRASGYNKSIDGYKNAAYVDMSLPYAAGSMYSTVEDLFKWDQSLRTDKLISKAGMAEIFKPRKEAFNAMYAFGWIIDKKKFGPDEFEVIVHGGGINGFNTLNFMIPAKGIYIILLSNLEGVPLTEMAGKIVQILNGEEVKMPLQSLAEYIGRLIKSKGIEEALNSFRKLKDNKEAFSLRELEMNQLGYSLMADNMLDEAIEVFKITTEEFSKSWNVYDSYGEALAKRGMKDAAIVNYKKSLELNPHSATGIKALKELGVTVDEPIEAKLSDEKLKEYVGNYQLAPNFVLAIRTKGDKIFTQATGQEEIEIFLSSEDNFYLKVVNAQLKFIRENGKVTKLILFQNGREMPAKKLE